MPSLADITVKMANGTTDIIYNGLAASAGDGVAAVWRQDTGQPAGLPIGLRPMFKVWTQFNGPKTARQVKHSFVYPYAVQDSTTTLYSARDKVVIDNGVWTVPQGIPSTVINEACAQYSNLMGSALVKSMAQTGYAAT